MRLTATSSENEVNMNRKYTTLGFFSFKKGDRRNLSATFLYIYRIIGIKLTSKHSLLGTKFKSNMAITEIFLFIALVIFSYE